MRIDTEKQALDLSGILLPALLLLLGLGQDLRAQVENQAVHRRGRIWEEVWNDGMIGNGGAWDYLTSSPLGMFPGFAGFSHPVGGEQNAINTFSNANFHNFRSGFFMVARDLLTPGLPPNFNPTPSDYEFYATGAQGQPRGILSVRAPIAREENFSESEEDFNPLLPEESIVATWQTNLGITVTRRSYVWSYPRYRDFIIYDYILENTGDMVSILADQLVPNKQDFEQTIEGLYAVVHSAISVSTKSTINFHSDLTAVQAGAFGWLPPYHDFYYLSQDGTLAFSYNVNGGAEPPSFDPYPVKDNEAWKVAFGDELQSPAGFGVLALYADPIAETPRSSAKPDVLRIDVHKGGSLNGRDLDLEFFKTTERTPAEYYEFVTSPDKQDQLGNDGNRFNIYTMSYGPYQLAPGEKIRIVYAEIAGVMDYAAAAAGDPDGLFPDATIDAVLANAQAARQAVAWGLGATVDGAGGGSGASAASSNPSTGSSLRPMPPSLRLHRRPTPLMPRRVRKRLR